MVARTSVAPCFSDRWQYDKSMNHFEEKPFEAGNIQKEKETRLAALRAELARLQAGRGTLSLFSSRDPRAKETEDSKQKMELELSIQQVENDIAALEESLGLTPENRTEAGDFAHQ
jgi:hypothetical protein